MPPDLIPVDHDPFADAAGAFPTFDAAGQRPPDIDPSTGLPALVDVAQAPRLLQRLFGTKDLERFQTWPERMVRSGLSLPHDVVAGSVPIETRVGFPGASPEGSGDVLMEPNALGKALGMNARWRMPSPEGEIGRTQDLTALALGSPLAERPGAATLGSGMTRPNEPYLVPAIKLNGKVYRGNSARDEHMDVAYNHNLVPKHVTDADSFVNWADSLPNDKNNDWGFVNSKGHFLSREKAGVYAADHGLVAPEHIEDARHGIFTADMLLSDPGTPGSSVAALGKTAAPFYSAVEHAINNVRNDKMSPEQWVGYLRNQPGVKAEELAWMGLDDPGKFNPDGKKLLTKDEMLAHAKEHGVKIKEVRKSDRNISEDVLNDAHDQFVEDHGRAPQSERELIEYVHERDAYMGANDFGTPGTKFSNWQLLGGDNYRELLFTLPSKGGEQVPLPGSGSHLMSRGDYVSRHWDEPNVLAHARMNDRILPDATPDPRYKAIGDKIERGGIEAITPEERALYNELDARSGTKGLKTLHLEELQSDWHQQGRKQGYKTEPPKVEVVENDGYFLIKINGQDSPHGAYMERKGAERMATRIRNNHSDDGLIPDAPFKTTWPDLVLKRMIREASENGYDAISWTPGEAQAARYDLSKQLNAVGAVKNKDGTFSLEGFLPSGGVHDFGKSITAGKLADYVGKDLAEKIIKQKETAKEYSGVDLRVGGEGMKAFYDKMLVDKVNAIAKKFGGKVEQQALGEKGWRVIPAENKGFRIEQPDGKLSTWYSTEAMAREAIMDRGGGSYNAHVLRLPQALKDVATRRGFPLFAAGLPFQFTPVDYDPFAQEK